jgi:hypothetical protein
MDGITRARVFLLGLGIVFLPLIGLPLFIDPYWWGDLFGWDTSVHTDLTTYLGRCLGAVAIAISGVALWGSRDPARYGALFEILVIAGVLLAAAHLRGLFEGDQPTIEDVEVLIYGGAAALAWWCKPAVVDARSS